MQMTFGEVLDSVQSLPFDDKEMLVDIIKKRMVEESWDDMRRAIEEARAEYKAELCKEATVDEIMAEIRS